MFAVLSSSRCPVTFVFLVSEWRMWDSTVFLLVLIHNTIKGQPLHDVENATAHWTSRAESTGFLLVISLLCSSVNCFSWARVQFVYLSSAQSGFFANCERWSDDLRPDVFVLQVGGYPGHNSTELWFPPSYHHNRRYFSSTNITSCNLPDLPKPTYYPTERLNVKHIWQLSFAGALKYLVLGAGK